MPVVGQWRWIELERDQERGSVSEVQLPLTRVAVLIFNYCPSRASVRACGRKYNRYRLHKGSGYHLYLQAELILLAVTRETDFEDRGAHHIAKQHDPQGKRTIGVLTKPDRIPVGEEESWFRFIRNDAEPLANGWFTVKQPASGTLKTGMTWAEARKQEKHFFSSSALWSSAESFCQKRFGTQNLTESLSKILSDLIKRRLPELADELQSLLKQTETRLRNLPKPPPQNPVADIIEMVSGFSRSLSTYIEGTPDERGIHQTIRPLHMKFSKAIRDTAPDFRPHKAGEATHFIPPSFLAAEQTELGIDEDVVYVDQVMDMAAKGLIKEAIEMWADPGCGLPEAEHAILEHTRGEGEKVKSVVNDVLVDCHAMTLQKIDWLLEMEAVATFTLNEHYFPDYRQKFLESCRDSRASENSRGEENVNREVLIARDRFGPPLHEIMASVQGYFQVSYKRFTDMAPMTIDQELLRGLDWDRGVRTVLIDGLEIAGPDSTESDPVELQSLF